MTVLNYAFKRTEKEVLRGWTPNWTRYCKWLKDRKIRQDKALAEANKRREMRQHNDKVLRMYGLGKYQNKGDW